MAFGEFFVWLHVLGQERRPTSWATDGPTGGYSSHDGSDERKSRGLGEFYLMMLYVPAYTYEHRPYPATVYPTSFTLDSLHAFTVSAQRKTYGWCSTPSSMAGGDFFCVESKYVRGW